MGGESSLMFTDDDIERVAIALFVSEIGGKGWPSKFPESAKEHWRKQARVAIEAMQKTGEICA